ncbi:MAG: CBS domain-containing protein [Thaumarchaeota archaeon]|nr:CBS domain-containing protein [Nitrososphaerota archaeon]
MPNKTATLKNSDYVEPVVTFDPSDPVSKLIGSLKESGNYEGFIEENGRTFSVAMRDLLDVENVVTTKLSTIMSPVPRLNLGDSVILAAKSMFEHRIRSLPVYSNGKLQGKITSISIAKSFVESTGFNYTLQKIMTPDPICADTSDSAAKARSIMIRRKVDQLPILDALKLTGIITSDDIVFGMVPEVQRDSKGGTRKGRFANIVSSLASDETTTNKEGDSLSKVMQNMLKFSTNYSVIVDNSKVKGIVTYRDFLKLVPFGGAIEPTPVTIIGLPDNPLESEIVKSKFTAAVQLLRKMDPTVMDVRAIIKDKMINSQKMLYQVQVFIDGTEWHENYKVDGYDISKIFSEIESWIKRIATRRDKKPDRIKRKTSRRYAADDEIS